MHILKKQLSLLLLVLLLLIPAIHKINATIPAEWFVNKFEKSLIGSFSWGIPMSYYLIIFLEITGPFFILLSMFLILFKKKYSTCLHIGFMIYYILFVILTFGSFLVQDYDNGFKDFIYFIGIMFIEQHYFREEKTV